MTALYRVFPYLEKSAAGQPGSPLYLPPQGGGRLDNPGLYSVLYLSDAAAGAVAEAFGRFPEWAADILAGSPSLPGSVHSLARYRIAAGATICDLDDPRQLIAVRLRPSDVVSRDYTRTRAWASRLHATGRFAGVRWWSYYDSKWASYGLWNIAGLALEDVSPLSLADPALIEASRTIVRRIIHPRR